MKVKGSAKQFAVITVDIIGSRKINAFRRKRDRLLEPIGKEHLRKKLIISPYAITAWDEFQAVLSKPTNIPGVIFDLRRHFFPVKLWIAVGIGSVSEAYKVPTNVFAGGEAFERARSAAETLKNKRLRKYKKLTLCNSSNSLFDSIINNTYWLHDTLIATISEKQWKVINVQLETDDQEETAKVLKKNQSTISRALRRGYFEQLKQTQEAMRDVIDNYWMH